MTFVYCKLIIIYIQLVNRIILVSLHQEILIDWVNIMNQSRRNKTQFIRFIKTVAISHTIMPFYKFTEIIWLNWVLFAKAHVLYAVARHLILPCQVTDGYWWNFI